jgi:hypothetical protein
MNSANRWLSPNRALQTWHKMLLFKLISLIFRSSPKPISRSRWFISGVAVNCLTTTTDPARARLKGQRSGARQVSGGHFPMRHDSVTAFSLVTVCRRRKVLGCRRLAVPCRPVASTDWNRSISFLAYFRKCEQLFTGLSFFVNSSSQFRHTVDTQQLEP